MTLCNDNIMHPPRPAPLDLGNASLLVSPSNNSSNTECNHPSNVALGPHSSATLQL